MAVYPIYKGNYDFNKDDSDPYAFGAKSLSPSNYPVRAGSIGLATDVRTANQLQEVSSKLSTGAKAIEVSAIQPNILDAIPKQHFEELKRLKDLVGAELTFHGPLIEPTGVSQNGWDESARQQAEKQIWSAVARSNQLNPDGNTVVTLHASNGLMAPSLRMKVPDEITGERKETITNLAVIDERTGTLGYLPKPKSNKFLGKENEEVVEKLKKLNQQNWDSELNNLTVETMRGRREIEGGLKVLGDADKNGKINVGQLYKDYKENKSEYEKTMSFYKNDPVNAPVGASLSQGIEALSYGDVFVRDSYRKLQEMYNKAYAAAESSKVKDSDKKLKQLDEYREQAAKKLDELSKDPLKIGEFSKGVFDGISLLSNLYQDGAPQTFRPLKDFAIEKASETFGNVAFNAYKNFGDNAPIISIENAPAGQGGGLARGDELRDLIKATHKHFVERAMNDPNNQLTQKEAEEQAKKLIGITWDVGHINMIKKYGYDDADLVKETKQVKDFVKHIHLSDNFGLEHTELPMGMGNVPLQQHLKELGQQAEKAKKIVETGDWYQHFKTAPLSETLQALGSPIYAMKMQPYWNAGYAPIGMSGAGAYFSGYGNNPDIHHSVYGAGFSGLPTELGGSIQGRGSRFGGTPME